jgi:hypothetical protein
VRARASCLGSQALPEQSPHAPCAAHASALARSTGSAHAYKPCAALNTPPVAARHACACSPSFLMAVCGEPLSPCSFQWP